VKDTKRLLSRFLLLPMLGLGLAVGQVPAASPGSERFGVTGSYLAGSQALFDLRTEEAARFLREALVVGWDNPYIVERGFVAYAANGDIEEAADTARRLLELDRQNDLARLVIATEAVKRRNYASAIEELSKIGSDNFAGITGGILRAWAFAGSNRIDEANAELDRIGRNGLTDFLVFHRALMAEVTGRNEEAIGYARQAYEVEPFVARIVEAYARMLGNAGRFDEAEEVLQRYAAEGLAHPLVAIVADAVDKRQRPGLFAPSVQAGASEMFHGIGVALARDGNSDLALVFLRLGLYLNPEADVIALVLGQILDGAGEHQAANSIYDAVAADSPLKSTAVVRVAENLDAMGNREEALRRLASIVQANPEDLDALSVLGDLQRTAKRYSEAAATYTRAIELVPGDSPSDWRFYYVRGIAYERNQEWPKAEADFKRALELRPNQPQVLNYLGYSWVDKGINLEPALELIETAVAAAPNDGYIVDSLGWAFYRLGRFEEAVKTLERAVQLRPSDAEINDHLGDAYWRAGRQLEARFQWRVAADVDDEGNVKARVQPKLAKGLDPLADQPVAEPAPDPLHEPAARTPVAAQ
jgi:tetratricopeptide (TPR) repeat protein